MKLPLTTLDPFWICYAEWQVLRGGRAEEKVGSYTQASDKKSDGKPADSVLPPEVLGLGGEQGDGQGG